MSRPAVYAAPPQRMRLDAGACRGPDAGRARTHAIPHPCSAPKCAQYPTVYPRTPACARKTQPRARPNPCTPAPLHNRTPPSDPGDNHSHSQSGAGRPHLGWEGGLDSGSVLSVLFCRACAPTRSNLASRCARQRAQGAPLPRSLGRQRARGAPLPRSCQRALPRALCALNRATSERRLARTDDNYVVAGRVLLLATVRPSAPPPLRPSFADEVCLHTATSD